MKIKERLSLTAFLMLFAMCYMITALHDEGEASICSKSESGESVEAGVVLQKIVNVCFGDGFDSSVPNINVCDSMERLDCTAVKSVLSIIPSCKYCDNTAKEKKKCYLRQIDNTWCSMNDFLSKIQCVKSHGKCARKIFHDVTSVEQTTVVVPEETTIATHHAESDHLNKKGYVRYDNDCEPCDCSQSDKETGVSVGMAVGLLFLGVVIGIVGTAVICICVPSLHSRTSILKGKMTEKVQKSGSHTNTYPGQQEPESSVTDSTLPAETTINYPVTPTAPVSSLDTNQARYHSLGAVSNFRDSHTYTGIQPDSPKYFEPMEGGDKYESSKIQPIGMPSTVVSPVYQEFTDNVIQSTEEKSDKQEAIRNKETNDVSSKNYSILQDPKKPKNVNFTDSQRPLSDHPYFVLEKQNEPQASSDGNNKADPTYHEYFVLEKE